MLHLNWIKFHSIIWSVTCHGLRNFPLLIHIPLYPFVNFQNPMSYYLLSLSFDPPHPNMTQPILPHPYMTHPIPTPTWHTHPTLPHPTSSWPTTPPYPTPGTFLGTKEPFFMGCFTVSLLVDKNSLNNFICHLSWLVKWEELCHTLWNVGGIVSSFW